MVATLPEAPVVPMAPAALAAGNVELAFHVAKIYLRRARALGVTWEDLHQEAVVALLRASRGFNPAVGVKFSSYAGVAVRHHLHNVLTTRRYHATRGLPTHEDGALIEPEDRHTVPPDAAAILADEKERVARLMRLLLPRERAIFQMYFWDDMSFAQIGTQVGLSGERVRQIFDRSLRRLRQAAHANNGRPAAAIA
ncbi:MAG TPA: sigma-70 family RNA polymerase sigma factor [Gemmataceae bacterium]|nr:sigma-70 family RNA polymerase sigma factor [Gemmataceae bacterium]